MSEGGTLVAARLPLAYGDPGASQACIPGPRDRWQASTGSYTEAELWLYRGRTMGLLRRYRRLSIGSAGFYLTQVFCSGFLTQLRSLKNLVKRGKTSKSL